MDSARGTKKTLVGGCMLTFILKTSVLIAAALVSFVRDEDRFVAPIEASSSDGQTNILDDSN